MTIKEAAQKLAKELPGRCPIKYMEHNGGYLIFTKLIGPYKNMSVPSLYVIDSTGNIRGASPLEMASIDVDSMTKIG